MIDKELLSLLACPDNQTPLREADEATIARLNQAIAQGRVKTKGGRTVTEPLAAGLIRQDGKLLYPIVDGIPVMLVDEAIPLDRIS